MKTFIIRQWFRILACATALSLILVLFEVFVPAMHAVGKEFTSAVSELRSPPQSMDAKAADSLIKGLNILTTETERLTNQRISSSGILKVLLGTAKKNGVEILDLSTREETVSSQNTEYPVTFKAQGSFRGFLAFIADLESGSLCVKVSSLKMQASEGKLSAGVELSVLVRRSAE
ncbi:MAG: type 4a pilus biogenesis protein PilO [Sphaerochaetaceae bacterium]